MKRGSFVTVILIQHLSLQIFLTVKVYLILYGFLSARRSPAIIDDVKHHLRMMVCFGGADSDGIRAVGERCHSAW